MLEDIFGMIMKSMKGLLLLVKMVLAIIACGIGLGLIISIMASAPMMFDSHLSDGTRGLAMLWSAVYMLIAGYAVNDGL